MQDFIPISVNQQLSRISTVICCNMAWWTSRLIRRGWPSNAQKFQSWDVPVLFMRPKSGQLFTEDPVRPALTAMVAHKLYNPLAADTPYLPVEVQHFKGWWI
jgi:hypothetical protein